MKILHFSSLDSGTGAGVAAARIHRGLLARGVQSRFCVAYPSGGLPQSFTPRLSLPTRLLRSVRQALDLRRMRGPMQGYDYVLSSGDVGFDMGRIIAEEKPDVVQLHWIAGNSFRLWSLAGVTTPIVWRLSDQWSFCGLQHLEPDAQAYTAPPSSTAGGWSEALRRRKAALYRGLPQLKLAAPSRWMMREAASSALLGDKPLTLIPTSCDTAVFFPRDKAACRSVLGLDPQAQIILVGASSLGTKWKGMDLFVDAVVKAKARAPNRPLTVLTFGVDTSGAKALGEAAEVIHMGPIRDRLLMSVLYGAADVFAAPSRMENLANTVLEALACARPVVAFRIGGMPDMIDDRRNGALADPFDTDQMADGLLWALDHRDDAGVHQAAQKKIEATFSLDQEVDAYLNLYQSALSAT